MMWVLVMLVCTGTKCEARLDPGHKTREDCERTGIALKYRQGQMVGTECVLVTDRPEGDGRKEPKPRGE